MRQETIDTDSKRVTMWEDGQIEIQFNDLGSGAFQTTAGELAYILQEYQRLFGGIPARIDFSQWRGIKGKP